MFDIQDHSSELDADIKASNKPIAVVSAAFNKEISMRLIGGVEHAFKDYQHTFNNADLHWVPGAFELPFRSKQLIQTGRYAAIICVATIIKGDTAHFEYVANECSRGVMDLNLAFDIPSIFCVLTTLNKEQALERSMPGKKSNSGYQSAKTALYMASKLA